MDFLYSICSTMGVKLTQRYLVTVLLSTSLQCYSLCSSIEYKIISSVLMIINTCVLGLSLSSTEENTESSLFVYSSVFSDIYAFSLTESAVLIQK